MGAVPRGLEHVDQLRRNVLAVSGAAILVAALAGCTGGAEEAQPTSPPAPSASSAPTASPSPSALLATYADDEEAYGKLNSVRGLAELGPFDRDSEGIAVYVRCFGEGAVSIEIEGVAEFEQQCLTDANDPGTRNTFDARYVDRITVRGQADNNQLWSLAVTALPAR